MCDIQTQCPNCDRQYLVSPAQLSIAQGMVCCSQCEHVFSAYEFLSHPSQAPTETIHHTTSITHHPVHQRDSTSAVLAIFERKLDSSNTDLLSYLNSHQFNDDTLFNHKQPDSFFNFAKKPIVLHVMNVLAYILLLSLNIFVLSIVISQISNNNHELKSKFPVLELLSTETCNLIQCNRTSNTNHRVHIKSVHIYHDAPQLTTITGQLVNQGSALQQLPKLQAIVHQQVFSFTPEKYVLTLQNNNQLFNEQQTLYFRIDLPLDTQNQSIKLQIATD